MELETIISVLKYLISVRGDELEIKVLNYILLQAMLDFKNDEEHGK